VAPDLVAAAVLEDPPLYVEVAPEFQTVLDIRNKNLNVNDTAVELRKADAKSSDLVITKRAIAITKADPGIWESAVEGRIAKGWDPDVVLLMQASPDMGAALADTDATRASDLLPQGRYVKWDDVGHGMHAAQPERFVQLVNAFFGQVLRKS
jgi:pimeloyl-ACP methyl ester carboxylesterase